MDNRFIRENLLNRVCLKCADFSRQLSLHHAMRNLNTTLRQNFWLYINNNSIDMAVLNWCHLFGSHSEELHWKKVIRKKDEFRNELFSKLNIFQQDWDKYWDSVKEYRDKDIAHIEIHPLSYIPNMSMAFKSVAFYYNYVIPELKENQYYLRYPDDLSSYLEDCLEQTKVYIDQAFHSTSKLKEKVF